MHIFPRNTGSPGAPGNIKEWADTTTTCSPRLFLFPLQVERDQIIILKHLYDFQNLFTIMTNISDTYLCIIMMSKVLY